NRAVDLHLVLELDVQGKGARAEDIEHIIEMGGAAALVPTQNATAGIEVNVVVLAGLEKGAARNRMTSAVEDVDLEGDRHIQRIRQRPVEQEVGRDVVAQGDRRRSTDREGPVELVRLVVGREMVAAERIRFREAEARPG